ncbi:MAG TPA: beta-ketoacyl-ACP synthase II [bacterium]|nr:beta-ketoacyl-ACP synthase II [bacterium]HOL35671.1 beta-ketoacyl-ACP synthase II [bacterium]HPP08839.1 beta-ketoacyl-ACP synthase II [bacterium]
MKEKHEVVITGMGLITPVGNNVPTAWNNVVNGKSGIGLIRDFDVSEFPTKIAAEVKDFNFDLIDKKSARRMDRFVQFALVAAHEAITNSGLKLENEDKEKIGVIIGAGIGGLRVIEQQHSQLLNSGPSRVSPLLIPMLIPDMAAGQVAITFGLKGPNFATVSACASGAHAIAVACELIRTGKMDIVITGGTESCITPLGLAGFCSMKALSERNHEPEKASRPFDAERDGFVMGEGSGIVVMESLEHAKARGSRIYAKMLGYGMSCDAYHITAPDPTGSGPYLCIKYALEDAGITPQQVTYINAHGTSTPLNDKSETLAIKKALGEHAYKVPISSNKSMIGHLLGAAGAVEFIFTILTIYHGIIPPTINYQTPDSECDLDYVPNSARKADVEIALSNSFGFGGHNICLCVQKYKGD